MESSSAAVDVDEPGPRGPEDVTLQAKIRRDVVPIQGGNLPGGVDAGLHSAWLAPITMVNDREFVTLDTSNSRFMNWLGKDRTTVDYFADCRNKAFTKYAEEAIRDQDSMAEVVSAKGKRKEMADNVSEIIDVPVHGEIVSMVSTWHSQHKVQIELSEKNLELLLRPAPSSTEFVPVITEPNVRWCPKKHSVFRHYFDPAKGERCHWRQHYEPAREISDPDRQQAEITRVERACQNFYDTHHVDPASVQVEDQPE